MDQNEGNDQDEHHLFRRALQPGEVVKIGFFDIAIDLGKQFEGPRRQCGVQQSLEPGGGKNNAHDAPNYNKRAAAFALRRVYIIEVLSYPVESRCIVSRRILFLLSWLAILSPSIPAQSTLCDDQQLRPRSPYDSRPRDPSQGPDIPADMQRKQMKELNQERYTTLKKDTDKLLQIATELKQKVDKTNENQLSLEVIRKTEEVEKLAKSIRDKMKNGGYCELVLGQSQ